MKDIEIRNYLKNETVRRHVFENLHASLMDIGFIKEAIDNLLADLQNLDPEIYSRTFKDELEEKYRIGFFQKYVPEYFFENIVKITPKTKKIIDIGCGTGILAKLLASNGVAETVVGIDINPYPEWKEFESDTITFKEVHEDQIISFLQSEKPDVVFITWTLHHMNYSEQLRYIKYISDVLVSGSRLVLLEDSYSTKHSPKFGKLKWENFMSLSLTERHMVMSIFDWVANRILAQRSKVPIPCTYRTMEDWEKVFTENGFEVETESYIGFPDKRDINTPQSLIIFKRI